MTPFPSVFHKRLFGVKRFTYYQEVKFCYLAKLLTFNSGSDGEVAGWVVHGIVAISDSVLRHPAWGEVFPADYSRIPDGLLVHAQHVVAVRAVGREVAVRRPAARDEGRRGVDPAGV